MKLFFALVGVLLFASIASAQGTDTQIRYGATNPATCADHALFVNTTTSPSVLYECTATNTWSALVDLTGTQVLSNKSLATILTSTKCAANGSGASPSAVACSTFHAGSFSCATNASTATCVVSTSAVTANSAVFVQPSSAAGSLLSVTCNTTSDTGLVSPRLASISAGTSFTINLGAFSANPLCFNYIIVN